MTKPFLSFGIPTYNRPDRLFFLLDSIFKQKEIDHHLFEVIVSDNSRNNDTAEMIRKQFGDKQNIRYHKNAENIGAERNVRQVFDLSSGVYTWLIPDDDFLTHEHSLKTVIDGINKYDNGNLSFVITNLRGKHLFTQEILFEKINPINKDIFFEEGKDILNVIDDTDLLGAQRLIVKKSILPHPFEQKHTQTGFVGCMSIALVAASKGSALYIADSVVTFCDGDASSWRSKVPKIYYLDMSYLLLESERELNYSKTRIREIIEQKKSKLKPVFNPLYFLFQMNGLKWRSFIELYGFVFVLRNIILSPFNIILNTKYAKKTFGRRVTL